MIELSDLGAPMCHDHTLPTTKDQLLAALARDFAVQ